MCLKKEMESLIIAAQYQALNINNMHNKVLGENISPICRLYVAKEETLPHILSEYPELVQNGSKETRPDNLAMVNGMNINQ